MKKAKMLFVSLVISSLSFSCSQSQNIKSEKEISEKMAGLLVAQGKNSEAADVYALLGERNLSVKEEIVSADRLFKRAIELDNKNARANFYSALTSPLMVGKGFTRRFNALLNEKQKQRLQNIETEVMDSGVQDLIQFSIKLAEDKTPVKNMREARKFLQLELLNELKNSSAKLNVIQNGKLQLNLQILKDKAGNELKVMVADQYDIKALRAVFKTYEAELTLATLFNIDDLQIVSEKLKTLSSPTEKDVVQTLKQFPDLLTIESKDEVKNLFNTSEDVLNNFLEFASLRDTLCDGEKRLDNLSAICISEKEEDYLKQLIMLIAGPAEHLLGNDTDGNPVTIVLNLRALENSSVNGLQDILPGQFDENGKALNFKDKTLGGLFPNGDLVEKLQSLHKDPSVSEL